VNPLTTTSKYLLTVDKREICYLQWIIDSYDGIASVRTIDPARGDIEISIAPGCQEEVFSLIRHLEGEGRIHIKAEKFYK
jgi:hypothetical protein